MVRTRIGSAIAIEAVLKRSRHTQLYLYVVELGLKKGELLEIGENLLWCLLRHGTVRDG